MTLSSDKQGEAQCPDCGGSIAEHQYIGSTGPDWKCVEPSNEIPDAAAARAGTLPDDNDDDVP